MIETFAILMLYFSNKRIDINNIDTLIAS